MRREDVDDVAADGDFTGLLHEGHALIAEGDELDEQLVPVDLLSDRDADRRAAEQGTRRDTKRERRARSDDDRRRLGGFGGCGFAEAMEDLHALAHEDGLGREAVEGEGVVSRKGSDP